MKKAEDATQVASGTRAIIDHERCTACGVCVGFCPERAITVENIAAIDVTRCTGCGECVEVCPNAALSLSENERCAAG